MTNKTKNTYHISYCMFTHDKRYDDFEVYNVVQKLIMLLTWGLLTSNSQLGMVGGGRQV